MSVCGAGRTILEVPLFQSHGNFELVEEEQSSLQDVIIIGVDEDNNGSGEDEDAHAHNKELQESGVVCLDVLHPNIPAVELLHEDNAAYGQVHQLQRVTATPLSIFQDRHNLKVQAFPMLYPDTNGFGTPRAVKISPSR